MNVEASGPEGRGGGQAVDKIKETHYLASTSVELRNGCTARYLKVSITPLAVS